MQVRIDDNDEGHNIKFEEMDCDKLTIDISCNSEEGEEKILKILFVAGIQRENEPEEDEYERKIVCKVDTEIKFKRFIKTVGPWLGFTEGMIMSSPMFKRYLRKVRENDEENQNGN